MWRRVRRRLTGRQTLDRHDIVGYPGVPEFNRSRGDTRLSPRGRVIFLLSLLGVAVVFRVLVLLTR
jgi:hypothetical protein